MTKKIDYPQQGRFFPKRKMFEAFQWTEDFGVNELPSWFIDYWQENLNLRVEEDKIVFSYKCSPVKWEWTWERGEWIAFHPEENLCPLTVYEDGFFRETFCPIKPK